MVITNTTKAGGKGRRQSLRDIQALGKPCGKQPDDLRPNLEPSVLDSTRQPMFRSISPER